VTRPRLLDLFCGAGGASVGYARAGFDVVGVDIVDQPHYPFAFIRADALDVLANARHFDAVHASPPCQWGTAYKRRPDHVRPAPNLIGSVRAGCLAAGVPYAIEQPKVNAAALEADRTITLTGMMFGLDVLRARCFETNVPVVLLPCPDRSRQTPRFPHATNRVNLRRTVEVGAWRISLEVQRIAMGIDWMSRPELSQAIPPAYTEWIGGRLLDALAHGEQLTLEAAL
jgi:DNA (cytosine-5)-methyltransferase 1